MTDSDKFYTEFLSWPNHRQWSWDILRSSNIESCLFFILCLKIHMFCCWSAVTLTFSRCGWSEGGVTVNVVPVAFRRSRPGRRRHAHCSCYTVYAPAASEINNQQHLTQRPRRWLLYKQQLIRKHLKCIQSRWTAVAPQRSGRFLAE